MNVDAPDNRIEQMLLGAQDELSRALSRAQRRVTDEHYGMLVDWAGYLRISRGLAVNTGARYVEAMSRFLEFAGNPALGDVTPSDIERWHQHMYLEERLKAQTRDKRLVGVRRFFVWREAAGHGVSPARSIKGPKVEKRVARKYSAEQLRRLFAVCDRTTVKGRRDFAVLMFFYATGARRMEVVNLNIQQLELHQRGGQVRFDGKGAKERTVAFDAPLANALRAWFADREALPLVDRDAVFVGVRMPNTGRRMLRNGLADIVISAGKRAGIKSAESGYLGLHKLRVTFATDLYDLGVDLKTIAHIMGHDDINTTNQYVAISERRLKTRMPGDRLNDLTGEKHDKTPLWLRRKRAQLGGEGGTAGDV